MGGFSVKAPAFPSSRACRVGGVLLPRGEALLGELGRDASTAAIEALVTGLAAGHWAGSPLWSDLVEETRMEN